MSHCTKMEVNVIECKLQINWLSKIQSLAFQRTFQVLHTVSFDWFLSSLEWILNLEFCLLKLLIFYQKLSWNIRSRLNSSTFWVFRPVFRYVGSKLKLCAKNTEPEPMSSPISLAQTWLDRLWCFWGCWATFIKHFFH